MRTNRTTLAAVLSIVLVALPGAVTAQAADEVPSTPSYWTGTETRLPDFWVPGVVSECADSVCRWTVGLRITLDADDPRASGDVTVVFTYDRPDGNDSGRGTGLARLVNSGGTFQGPLHVVYYPDGSEFRMALMEGQDGYAGLSLTMTDYLDPSGKGKPQGLIWEGDPPALPDADLLPE